MSDPTEVTTALDRAADAFEYRDPGRPEFEDRVDQDSDWTTQLTKGCRYLAACRALREQDGYWGPVIELSFGAIERSLEGFLLWDTDDDLADFQDHDEVYDRATERGLFAETATDLKALYSTNRTAHYYGGLVPTRSKAEAMFDLARAVHAHAVDQIRVGGVCSCEPERHE